MLTIFCWSFFPRSGFNFPHSGAMHKFAHKQIFKLMWALTLKNPPQK